MKARKNNVKIGGKKGIGLKFKKDGKQLLPLVKLLKTASVENDQALVITRESRASLMACSVTRAFSPESGGKLTRQV